MGDLGQRLDRMEDFACEVLLFVVDTVASVAGILYYVGIGITLVMAFHFPVDPYADGSVLSRRDIGITRSITWDVGVALVWGLAHVVAEALDARQAARSRERQAPEERQW